MNAFIVLVIAILVLKKLITMVHIIREVYALNTVIQTQNNNFVSSKRTQTIQRTNQSHSKLVSLTRSGVTLLRSTLRLCFFYFSSVEEVARSFFKQNKSNVTYFWWLLQVQTCSITTRTVVAFRNLWLSCNLDARSFLCSCSITLTLYV